MKKLYIARDPIDAQMLQELLKGQGIEAVILDETIHKIGKNLSYDISPTLWVTNDAEYESAVELITHYRKEDDSNLDNSLTWRCVCGEENENIFTECWNCGKGRQNRK